MSDEQLMELFYSGSPGALEFLIRRHQNKIYTSICFFVRNTHLADDIFQETFIKVLHTLHARTYKEEGKFSAWVIRIAYNLCVDHFRRTRRQPRVSNAGDSYAMGGLKGLPEVYKNGQENAQDRIIRDETAVMVRKMLDMLPYEQREVVILRHYSDLSFREIADLTGVSLNTALGRMRYALNNMRKMLLEKVPAR